MTDIFISYANQDRNLASSLAQDLLNGGYSVWWDTALVGGVDFREQIHGKLAASRCVVVIWTQHSISSRWVRDEADEAIRSKKLIPIRTSNITDVMIPLGFRGLHTLRYDDRSGLLRALNGLDVLGGVRGPVQPLEDVASLKQRIEAGDSEAALVAASKLRQFIENDDIDGAVDFMGPLLQAMPFEDLKEMYLSAPAQYQRMLLPHLPKGVRDQLIEGVFEQLRNQASSAAPSFWGATDVKALGQNIRDGNGDAANYAIRRFGAFYRENSSSGELSPLHRLELEFESVRLLYSLPKAVRHAFFIKMPESVRDICLDKCFNVTKRFVDKCMAADPKFAEGTNNIREMYVSIDKGSETHLAALVMRIEAISKDPGSDTFTKVFLYTHYYLSSSGFRRLVSRLSQEAVNQWFEEMLPVVWESAFWK